MSEDGVYTPPWVRGMNGANQTWLVRYPNGEEKWVPLPIAWPDEWVAR